MMVFTVSEIPNLLFIHAGSKTHNPPARNATRIAISIRSAPNDSGSSSAAAVAARAPI